MVKSKTNISTINPYFSPNPTLNYNDVKVVKIHKVHIVYKNLIVIFNQGIATLTALVYLSDYTFHYKFNESTVPIKFYYT